MKSKVVYIYLLLFAITFISCQKEHEKSNFSIILDIKFSNNDEVELFYTLTDSVQFNENQKITYPVQKGDAFHQMIFNIKTVDCPKKIRLDLAKNNQTKSVEINNLQVFFRNKRIHFDNQDLGLNFLPNKYVKLEDNGSCILKPNNNNFDPYLTLSPFFFQRLKIEY